MLKNKFMPCDICINNLRRKLFMLKNDFNMLSYNQVIKYIKKNIIDHYAIYSDNVSDSSLYNLEHIVPVNVLCEGKRPDRNKININFEAVSDSHLIIPCGSDINYLRSNKAYGIFIKNRSEALEKNIIIINDNKIYNYPKIISDKFRHLKKMSIEELNNLDDKNDMYLSENMVQPPQKYYGDIARIVFYFYLMYGHNFMERPISKCKKVELLPGEPWFMSSEKEKLKVFNYENWSNFFFNHLNDYRKWAKNNISDREHKRNKNMIEHLGVANIFIGYKNNKNEYIPSNSNIVEELFFGKSHDHNKYLEIEFLTLDKKKSLYYKNRVTKNKILSTYTKQAYEMNKQSLDKQLSNCKCKK
ncbi:hypothetical protein Catovirus_1_68 [Catovirus CTV1]|uniref:Uncharacterized protein n=1 Tax=Catovirus CTV1 TaxID=1977631 RepID=A0A1V0S8Q6_9VIRU|nr:hypothetical protein Catovirus_1_68 [Catovirus CTV1]